MPASPPHTDEITDDSFFSRAHLLVFGLLIFSYIACLMLTTVAEDKWKKKHRPKNDQINIFSGHRKINQRAKNADEQIAYTRCIF